MTTIHGFVLVVLYSTIGATAFRLTQSSYQQQRLFRTTELNAWSIPTPDMSALTSMKSTWYQECNPTARKTVYNDVFLDYGNAEGGEGNDYWVLSSRGVTSPSIASPTTSRSNSDQGVRKGPLRRAARWTRKHLARGGIEDL
mmetsp:Transcript_19206/g.24722  ORF Transcript_19206/g.24722 Transcript_19206/m.24722 type:complete len:142 (-) Transcript_19206:330-755(-)|eukprot:CAMPEP_0198143886 /NCGR_PEP_ID=MMETSP1443-20131203/11341_1 /TAXON_ID=186043 /ORGANISM="Entomoneis sp., Strain CCMP2396" /LENGTH=141 /DNA_ID=CAMNT_0043807187 /DNA_START=115 /DNA_END=540 /DNA_ORIENTATION=-